MSDEEKRKNKCRKCGVFFHEEKDCTNSGPLCYACGKFGHLRINCTSELKNIDNLYDLTRISSLESVNSGSSAIHESSHVVSEKETDTIVNRNVENEFKNSEVTITIHKLSTNHMVESLFDSEISMLVDSGASHHAVPSQDILSNFVKYVKSKIVKTAVNENGESSGHGTLTLMLECQHRKFIVKLRHVQVVCKLTDNILSVRAFNRQFGTRVMLNANTGMISSGKLKTKIALIHVRNEVYRLQAKIAKDDKFQMKYTKILIVPTCESKVNATAGCSSVRAGELLKPDDFTGKTIVTSISGSGTHDHEVQLKTIRKKKTGKKALTKEKLDLLVSEGDKWHSRMGHLSATYLNKLKQVATGLPEFVYKKTTESCATCALSKSTRKTFGKDRERASRPNEIVHTDLIGPISPKSTSQSTYLLTVVDDYTRYAHVYALKNKFKVPKCLDAGLASLAGMFNGQKFRFLRCDNGTEFVGAATRKVLDKYDYIQVQVSEPFAHEHNGLIERFNRTIEEKIRSLLVMSGLPTTFWGILAQTAAYIYNRTPHSAIDFITPFEKAFNKQPDVTNIRMIGCRAYVHDETIAQGKKLHPRAYIAYLVGFTPTGYRTYDTKTHKVQQVCNVEFDERFSYRHDYPNSSHESVEFIWPTTNDIRNTLGRVDDSSGTSVRAGISRSETETSTGNTRTVNQVTENANVNETQEQVIEIDYDWDVDPLKITKFSTNDVSESVYSHFDKHIYTCDKVPLTYGEATTGSEKDKWNAAIKSELESISKNKVWEIVPKKPKQKGIVPLKWIFSIKSDNTYKARLVAVGCKDSEVYTPAEKASPTPSGITVRWLLAFVACKNWKIQQYDIRTAFLNGRIDREKFVSVPLGLEVENQATTCLKLNKALYGLAIAPRCWYETFDKFLSKNKFKRSCRESCLYVKDSNGHVTIVLVYVDDILIVAEHDESIEQARRLIANEYELKSLGEPKRFLGLEIEKHDDYLTLKQTEYATKMLKQFNMNDCNSVTNPILPSSKYDETVEKCHDFPYKKAVGALLFLSNSTRPDLCFAVNYVARFQAEPRDLHWRLVKRIFRYIKGTLDYGLRYGMGSGNDFEVYVDADYGGDPQSRRSTTGYLIKYHGNTIHWRSKLQDNIVYSTAEAEYLAICEMSKDILFITRLAQETVEKIQYPILVHEDNAAAIVQCEKTSSRGKLKHIDQKYLIKQELFENNILKAVKIDTKEQLADILTKAVSTTLFTTLTDKILLKS